jgi:Rps23 Pro-64 3,4-dihydroxylase Tpa1-like proline 4-hydroxylase
LRVGTREIADVRECAGFEYWVAVMPEGQGLETHVDADEELRRTENEIRCPLFGSVYFPREDIVSGGALRLYGVSEQGITEELASPHRAVDVILPNFNRLVMYAGNTPHEVAPVREGTRYSLVMNVWLERPMGYE